MRHTRPPLILSLEPVLKCPDRRCGKLALDVSADVLTLRCKAKGCGVHWWATLFQPGNIRDQLRAQWDGDDWLVPILDHLEAPFTIEEPLYWQLWLSGHEHYQFTARRQPGGILIRTRTVFQALLPLRVS